MVNDQKPNIPWYDRRADACDCEEPAPVPDRLRGGGLLISFTLEDWRNILVACQGAQREMAMAHQLSKSSDWAGFEAIADQVLGESVDAFAGIIERINEEVAKVRPVTKGAATQ